MLVLLVGYYFDNHQYNFGDMLFEEIFTTFLRKKRIEYHVLKNNDYSDVSADLDLILLGGGEVIDAYFMKPLFEFVIKKKLFHVRMIGASIGYNPEYSTRQLDFLDECIYRNRLETIDNERFFFENDIVFSINEILKLDQDKINCQKMNGTLGIYLINEISNSDSENISSFCKTLLNNKFITMCHFVIFENRDIALAKKIANSIGKPFCKIIVYKNPYDMLYAMLMCEYHLCLRFHAHIVCYVFKQQFVSYCCTKKVQEFNKMYKVPHSPTHDVDEMVEHIQNRQLIYFKEHKFNLSLLEKIVCTQKIYTDKRLTRWCMYTQIYMNFEESLGDVAEISDQIEYMIFKKVDTIYKYGINEKLNMLYKDNERDIHKFFKIITDIDK
jgi:hypothetical protein